MKDIKKYNKRRALTALVLSTTLTALFFVSLMMRLFMKTSAALDTDGLRSYRMFTTDSNFLLAVSTLLTIPYQIDGYRKNNMHLPPWVMVLLYVSTTCTTLTFLVAATVLSPFAGFYTMMFKGSNFFMHTACPIVGLVLFLLVLSDHRVDKKHILWTMVPVLIYAVVYVIEAFVIGSDNGGWKDHYQFNTYMPWPVMCTILLLVTLGISCGLRILHNNRHKKVKALNIQAFQDYFYDKYPTIEDAIAALAKNDKSADPKNNDITVPRRIIYMLEDKYHSNKNMDELASIYVREYLA